MYQKQDKMKVFSLKKNTFFSGKENLYEKKLVDLYFFLRELDLTVIL